MHRPTIVRTFALALATAPLFAGCGGGRMSPAAPSMPAQPMTPAVIPFSENPSPDTAVTVGVRLTGEKPLQSVHYGRVLGYFRGRLSMTSQVVMLSPNVPVVFANVDKSLPHTASFLGKATSTGAPWPKTFNGSSTASKAGTHIGTPRFSTGAMSPGKQSVVYNSGAPGFYMFGCAFHYDSNGMRTVVVVK